MVAIRVSKEILRGEQVMRAFGSDLSPRPIRASRGQPKFALLALDLQPPKPPSLPANQRLQVSVQKLLKRRIVRGFQDQVGRCFFAKALRQLESSLLPNQRDLLEPAPQGV